MTSLKQAIVVRTRYPDENGGVRKLRRGKEIAQACHASIAFLTRKLQKFMGYDFEDEDGYIKSQAEEWISENPSSGLKGAFEEGYRRAKKDLGISPVELGWINGIFTKICLKVDTEEQLLEIQKRSLDNGLACHLITDRGLTEFKGVPTNTCLAIGPDRSEKIDEITKDLELY